MKHQSVEAEPIISSYNPKAAKLFSLIIFILLSLISSTLVYPVVIVIFTPVYIIRQIIKYLVRIRDPKCSSILTGMDAVLAHKDPYTKPLMRLNPYIAFVSKIDRSNIIKVINEQIIVPGLYPKLTQRIVRKFGYNFWYPVDNFDLECHVKYLNSEFPDKPVTRRELRGLSVETMQEMSFDPRFSPWDVVLVPNLIDEDNPLVKSGVFIRANHCLMDGYSMTNFVRKCAVKPWIVPAAQTYLKPKSGICENVKMVIEIFKALVTGPYHVIQELCFSDDRTHFLKKALSPRSKIEERTWVKEVEPSRISGERLKKLRHKYNVSVSSLLVTLCAESVIRYIRLLCNKNFSQLPKAISLQMAFPLPGHPGTMTNHWSFVRLRLEVGKESNPVKLLEIVHRQIEYFKGSVEPLINFMVPQLVGLLPINLHPKLEDLPKQTIMLTNVAGPVESVDTFGYKWDCIGLLGSSPIGTAFATACQNYMRRFWIDIGGVGTVFNSQNDLSTAHAFLNDVLNELENFVKDCKTE